MRNTRWISRFRRRIPSIGLAGALCFCGWGCHQHHYYYGTGAGVQACPPGTTMMPSTVSSVGTICDVPADGAVANSSRSTVIDNGRKSRVVVSQPSRSRSAYSWRPADSESLPAITHVEGAYDDSTVR